MGLGGLILGGGRWLFGNTLKWGAAGSVIGGVGKTVLNGQDLTAANLGTNTISSAKDIAGFTGEMAKEVIAPSPAPAPQPRGSQPSAAGASGYESGQGADGAEANVSSKIMDIFNNFSGTKFGQAFAPLMNFLRSSPIISGILTVMFGMMALSGQNTMPMRLLSAGLAGTIATQTGLFDSVTQGSGRNAPAVGGAESYYAPPRNQPHAGGPMVGNGRGGYGYDEPAPDRSLELRPN
jgi:hypothetical protein